MSVLKFWARTRASTQNWGEETRTVKIDDDKDPPPLTWVTVRVHYDLCNTSLLLPVVSRIHNTNTLFILSNNYNQVFLVIESCHSISVFPTNITNIQVKC